MSRMFYSKNKFNFETWIERAVKHREKILEEKEVEERKKILESLKNQYKECYWCGKTLTGRDLAYSKKVNLNICLECDNSLEVLIHDNL